MRRGVLMRCEMKMTADNFKQLATANFSTLTDDALNQYLKTGTDLICNMIELDPLVIEIVSRLTQEAQRRGA